MAWIRGGGGPRPNRPPAPERPPTPRRSDGPPSRRTQRVDTYEPAPPPTPFQPTPTPTPTPSSTPVVRLTSSTTPPPPVFLDGRSEAELAALQQHQPTDRNDCADYSIAASLNLLFGGSVQGSDVAAAADQVPWLLPGRGLRMWENGPTSPSQQANIVNGIARQGQLPLSAVALHPTTDELVGYLQQPNTAVIITISWDDGHIPQIARTGDTGTAAGGGAPLQLNAHAMVLAAYDPSHLDSAGNAAPWGFINSWADGGSEIYWMPDADFQQAWSHEIPLVGSHNAVVITKEPTPAPGLEASATPAPGPTATPTPAPAPTPEPGSGEG
jgi:hypothetical protein